MLIFFLFVAAVTVTDAKCGLWYQFSHVLDGPHWDNRNGFPSGWYHGDVKWAAGYESLDQFVICNDMEMFHQCNRAQQILDLFTTNNGLPPVTIGCAEHIACSANLPSGNGKFFCQNMDSYDICLHAQAAISSVNQTAQFPIRCVYAEMLSDNVPVLNYRQASPTTTTTTAPTIVTNVTFTEPPNTTAPASASTLKYASGIILLLLMFSLF
jgi:hypothetical protein